MATVYVISNLSNDQEYCIYAKRQDVNVVVKSIIIKGGSNIQNRRTLQASSQGVTTPISDEDYAMLEKSPAFKFHMEKGFVKVIKSNETDAKKKAEKMDIKDKSAQFTPEDYKNRGFKKPPTVEMTKIEGSN